jgi:uncharacterized membrane protein
MSSLKSKSVLVGLFTFLSIAYPLIVYYFSDHLSPFCLILGIVCLLLARATLPLWHKNKPLSASEKNTIYLSLLVALVMLILYSWDHHRAPLLYPVVMSLSLAIVMGFTLLYPPSLIERFARLLEPNLNSSGVRYTRKVTIAWLVFGVLNAIFASITVVLNDRAIWTLYNGLISYILMGLLMISEYLIRKRYKAKHSLQ